MTNFVRNYRDCAKLSKHRVTDNNCLYCRDPGRVGNVVSSPLRMEPRDRHCDRARSTAGARENVAKDDLERGAFNPRCLARNPSRSPPRQARPSRKGCAIDMWHVGRIS